MCNRHCLLLPPEEGKRGKEHHYYLNLLFNHCSFATRTILRQKLALIHLLRGKGITEGIKARLLFE